MFPKGEIDDTFVICSFVCNCCVCAREKTYCISVYLTDYRARRARIFLGWGVCGCAGGAGWQEVGVSPGGWDPK